MGSLFSYNSVSSPQMFIEVLSPDATVRAVVTSEGLLACVYTDVSLQVTCLLEGGAAAVGTPQHRHTLRGLKENKW